jgi:hypothetical protein
MRKLRFKLGLYVGIWLLLPASVFGQTRIDVEPFAGYYRPFGHFEPASGSAVDLPQTPQDLSGLALGAEVNAWLSRRFGVALEGSLARSTIPSVDTPEGPRGPTSAEVQTLFVQGLIAAPQSGNVHTWLSAGVGMIRHGGASYSNYGSPVDPAAEVGAHGAIEVGKRMSVTAGVTTLLYMFDLPMPPNLRLNPGSLERGRQTDLIFRIGAAWTIRPMR